jgi:hypothetical protein
VTPPTLGIRVDDDVFPRLLEARLADDLFRPTDGDRQHVRRWPPCRAVPERLGFTLEATFREREIAPAFGHQDQFVFGLLRSEWIG